MYINLYPCFFHIIYIEGPENRLVILSWLTVLPNFHELTLRCFGLVVLYVDSKLAKVQPATELFEGWLYVFTMFSIPQHPFCRSVVFVSLRRR